MKKKPNIIYIHSHDTGRFIQPYGAAVPSPNLQAFAGESVLFRQAFCANPTCSPSRAAMLSGQYPHVCGMMGLAHRGFEMKDYSLHLASYLKRQGYYTALTGQQHEIPLGRERELGYLEVLSGPNDGLKGAEEFLGREQIPDTFFLSVGFFETHREFSAAGPEDRPERIMPPPGLPDTPEIRADMAQFHASARILDRKIGRVLELLRQRGLLEESVVLVTTDHGIPFPGYKCNLTDGGIGVMLMLRMPGGVEAGRTVDGIVSQVDVFPTLCELAGIPIPSYVQGVSLLPLIRGETQQVRTELFAEINFHAACEPTRCIRTPRYKYIRRFSGYIRPVSCNVDAGLSKSVLLDAGWHETEIPDEELYDLMLDPCERINLIGHFAHRSIADDLRERLSRFMQETFDPLCFGPLRPPTGARVDAVDCLHPLSRDGTSRLSKI